MTKTLASKRFSWKFLLALFFACWTTLVLLCSGVIESEDGWLYLSVAKNLYYTHQFQSAPNEYPLLNVHMNTTQRPDGSWRTTGAYGYSLAMVPAVALSDIAHHLLHTPPSNHFPLEHDWTLHFFASMTNAFYASLIVVVVTTYMLELLPVGEQKKLNSKRLSLAVGLLTVFATNLLPLAKHSFPHILFTLCVVTCFYCVRRFAKTNHKRHLIAFIVSLFGVFTAYNVSYFLPLMPLILYFVMLVPRERRRTYIRFGSVLLLVGLIAKFHSVLEYLPLLKIHPKVFLEGMWGFLGSSGKSIFLYTPLLLLPVLFWHKLKKEWLPEYLAFGLLAGLYVFFFSNAAIPFVNGDLAPIWHGGMDWGPRYISTLIPFGMLLVGLSVRRLTKIQLFAVGLPLLIASIWIQAVAVSIPYLLQYRDIPTTIQIASNELSVYDYASFIPRFSPIYIMSKEFIHRVKEFRRTVDHGAYDVKLYDGFEVPLFTGLGPYRGFRSEGHISLEQRPEDPIRSLYFRYYNAQDFPYSSSSAMLSLSLNDHPIGHVTIPSSGNGEQTIEITPSDTKIGRNRIDLLADYPATSSASQVVYISQMRVNDQTVNLETLDYPDVSTGGTRVTPIPYQYFGNKMNDNWKLWYLRARITERTFDFWWVKNLYYWDRPQRALWIGFIVNLSCALGSWAVVARKWRHTKGNP